MIVLVGRRNSTGNAYHFHPECHYPDENHREWPKERAEEWGYEPCEICQKKEVEA